MATARSAAPRTSGAEAPPAAPRGRLVKPPSAVVPTGRAATVLPPGAACASGVRAAPDGAIGAANGKDDSYEDDELPKLEPEAGSVGAGDGAGAAPAANGGVKAGTSPGSTGGGTGAGGSATSTLPMRAEAPPSSRRPPPRVVPVASRAFTTSRDDEASGAAASSASRIWLRTGTAGCVACAARLATVPVLVRTPGTPSSGPLPRARDAGALDACASSHAGVGAEGAAGGVAEAAMGSRDTSGWSRSSAVIGAGRSGRGTGALEATAPRISDMAPKSARPAEAWADPPDTSAWATPAPAPTLGIPT